MIYSLQNTALQLDQAVQASYNTLILAGTGLVRLSGDQNISGNKTFLNNVNVTGALSVTGNSTLNSVAKIQPSSNNTVNLGSSNNTFLTGYFTSVSGQNGYFNSLSANTILGFEPLLNTTGLNVTITGLNVTGLRVSGVFTGIDGATIYGTTSLKDLNITGNIYATGAKTFSGSLFQSGDLSVTGNSTFRGKIDATGNLNFTGNARFTGAISLGGNISGTGSLFHTGNILMLSSTDKFLYRNLGTSSFNIESPLNVTGTTYIDGNVTLADTRSITMGRASNFTMSGTFSNTGDLYMSGTLNNSGNISGYNIFSTGVVSGKIRTNGNSTIPALTLNENSVSSLVVGGVEYVSGSFFGTNLIGNVTDRSIFNQTYCLMQPNYFFGTATTAPVSITATTGIMLSTGFYNIQYQIELSGAAARVVEFGLTGDGISNVTATLRSSPRAATVAGGATTTASFTSINQNHKLGFLVTGVTTTANGNSNHYMLDCNVGVSGYFKIQPLFKQASASLISGRNLVMKVTKLSNASGNGTNFMNGPWQV